MEARAGRKVVTARHAATINKVAALDAPRVGGTPGLDEGTGSPDPDARVEGSRQRPPALPAQAVGRSGHPGSPAIDESSIASVPWRPISGRFHALAAPRFYIASAYVHMPARAGGTTAYSDVTTVYTNEVLARAGGSYACANGSAARASGTAADVDGAKTAAFQRLDVDAHMTSHAFHMAVRANTTIAYTVVTLLYGGGAPPSAAETSAPAVLTPARAALMSAHAALTPARAAETYTAAALTIAGAAQPFAGVTSVGRRHGEGEGRGHRATARRAMAANTAQQPSGRAPIDTCRNRC